MRVINENKKVCCQISISPSLVHDVELFFCMRERTRSHLFSPDKNKPAFIPIKIADSSACLFFRLFHWSIWSRDMSHDRLNQWDSLKKDKLKNLDGIRSNNFWPVLAIGVTCEMPAKDCH